MDPDGLFDFLEPAKNGESSTQSSKEVSADSQSQKKKDKKRKSSPSNVQDQKDVMPSTSNQSTSLTSDIKPKEERNNDKQKEKEKKEVKRQRVNPPFIPTTKVTDEFTAQAIRQVPAASNADGATYKDTATPAGGGEDGKGSSSSSSSTTAPGGIVSTDSSVVPSLPTTGSLSLTHSVRHQVALPPNYPYVPLSQHVPPNEPARTYPFTLDPFQQTAIHSIQRGESVLVSAHTSAGKTVVAEYAIAQALKGGMRVVYTSPIKVSSSRGWVVKREIPIELGSREKGCSN